MGDPPLGPVSAGFSAGGGQSRGQAAVFLGASRAVLASLCWFLCRGGQGAGHRSFCVSRLLFSVGGGQSRST